MTSETQVEANKENAKLSTGPKDTEKTKFNAITHGLTAKSIKNEEDLEEIKKLTEHLISELKPTNVIEEIAINRIVVSLWKLNKITRIQGMEFYNAEIHAEDMKVFDTNLISNKEKEACPNISKNGEALQRYEINAESSLHKAINLILKIRKEKLGSFLQN
ncbi:MAG: hypothetical protein P8X70_00520 [Nanoarchaeota archaeon]